MTQCFFLHKWQTSYVYTQYALQVLCTKNYVGWIIMMWPVCCKNYVSMNCYIWCLVNNNALVLRLHHLIDNMDSLVQNCDNSISNALELTHSCLEPLTYWGQVTHICVSELTIIGSDNGLSPGRHQAIIWSNAGLLLIEPLGTNFSEISIGIQTLSFKKMHLNMSSAKWHPFCLGLNVLISYFVTIYD